ncbi:unnamed protein product [Orchesella dallaii]|uniref:Elongation of very long chain fatty acids protein n=1 Tax=Orchesella dallaii TaxID=48710 RepID=A0ABP1QJZ5_9HEXA
MGEKIMLNPVLIQVLAKIPGLRYFADFYWTVIDTKDPRADKYPTMYNPDTAALIVLSYLMIALCIGPRIMEKRRTPEFIQKLLSVYNGLMITINGSLAVGLIHQLITLQYDLVCQAVDHTKTKGDTVMTLLFGFYVSKIIELSDTAFLILKKNSKQLSFLHLYHHSTIIAATWIGVKFAPGGTTAIISAINATVHVFMYIYYLMMSLKVKIPIRFKMFLTTIQITQFCVTLIVCYSAMKVKPCGYPDWILTWLLIYMLSFMLLFGKFFLETYLRSDGKPGGTKKVLSNGVDHGARKNKKKGRKVSRVIYDLQDCESWQKKMKLSDTKIEDKKSIPFIENGKSETFPMSNNESVQIARERNIGHSTATVSASDSEYQSSEPLIIYDGVPRAAPQNNCNNSNDVLFRREKGIAHNGSVEVKKLSKRRGKKQKGK